MGTWSAVNSVTQCVETHVYRADNTYSTSSLDEGISGTYTFDRQANTSNRHAFSLEVTDDNQQFDCHGDNGDDVGLEVDAFAEFVNTDTVSFYVEASGGLALFTLTRNTGGE